MVDVTPKEPTHRRAIARGKVFMTPETTSLVARGAVSKGDVLAVARVAGIQAAKRTPDLIPLCHPLLVGSVLVNFRIEDSFIQVEAQVETVDRTGVEMEALTACSIACLTIYDMCKSADRSMEIGEIALWEKTGGRSGAYRRDSATGVASLVAAGAAAAAAANGKTGEGSFVGTSSGDVVDDIDQLLGTDFSE
jgi:cyclic pyranopterin phosphate synthase